MDNPAARAPHPRVLTSRIATDVRSRLRSARGRPATGSPFGDGDDLERNGVGMTRGHHKPFACGTTQERG